LQVSLTGGERMTLRQHTIPCVLITLEMKGPEVNGEHERGVAGERSGELCGIGSFVRNARRLFLE